MSNAIHAATLVLLAHSAPLGAQNGTFEEVVAGGSRLNLGTRRYICGIMVNHDYGYGKEKDSSPRVPTYL